MKRQEILGGNHGVDRKVMVAIDESEYSYCALMYVLDNLKDLENKSNELLIFMAQPKPTNVNTVAASLGNARMYCPLSATPDFVNSLREKHKKLALALLEKAKEVCANRGIKAETETEAGDPKTAICDAVEKYNVDLLVMGERDIGKIKRVFMGSVSNYCVQNAKCHVLVVKK